MASEPAEGKGRWRASRYGWVAGLCVAGFLVTYGVWLAIIVLGEQLQEWGVLGPVFFIALQTLQVILSPIPGEATGFLGGYLFGERLGFVYSTIGLPSAHSQPLGWAACWAPTPFAAGSVRTRGTGSGSSSKLRAPSSVSSSF